jgi:PD-(D/E)XK endonuclease
MGRPRGASPGRIPAPEQTPAQKAARQRGIISRQRGDLGEVAFLHKATSLGFMVAQPYGTIYPFDFILQGGQDLWRIQVKAVSHMSGGLYALTPRRHQGKTRRAYSKFEIDFVAVYIIPEETWYILPVREVVGRLCLLFRPKGYHRPDIYAHYREAWHLLREPDGLTFG